MDQNRITVPDRYPHHYDFHTALSLGLCSAIEEDLDVSSVPSIENANLLEAKMDSDLESDGSSFSYSSGTDSTAESDSEVDDVIAMESIEHFASLWAKYSIDGGCKYSIVGVSLGSYDGATSGCGGGCWHPWLCCRGLRNDGRLVAWR